MFMPSWCHCHSLSLAPFKIQIGFTYLVPADPGSPGQRAVKRVCVCVTAADPQTCSYTDTHTRLTALCPGLPRWAGTRKVKPIWILLKQETVSGSGISWAICKSAPRSRQITMPAPHHSVFYRPDALPAAQPTASKHWRHKYEAHHYDKKYYTRPTLLMAVKRPAKRSVS